MPFRICHRVPAKDRASVALLSSFTQLSIKTRQHNVVLVQNMDPVTSRSFDASIPVIHQTSVLRVNLASLGFAPSDSALIATRLAPGKSSLCADYTCR